MTLEQAINDAPFYRLVQRGDTAKDTARNLYDFALTFGGLSVDVDEGDPIVMGYRAGKCLEAITRAASGVMVQIFDDLGFEGAAVPARMGDIEGLSTEDTKKLFDIVFAVHELGGMKKDMILVHQKIMDTQSEAG